MMEAIRSSIKSMNNEQLEALRPTREWVTLNGKEHISWSILRDYEHTKGDSVLGDGSIVMVRYSFGKKEAFLATFDNNYHVIGWDRLDDRNSISSIISNFGVRYRSEWYQKR